MSLNTPPPLKFSKKSIQRGVFSGKRADLLKIFGHGRNITVLPRRIILPVISQKTVLTNFDGRRILLIQREGT